MGNKIYMIDDAKRYQSLYDYVYADLTERASEANCPTEIETLKKYPCVKQHPDLQAAIDEAWAERQKDIRQLHYYDHLGGALLGIFLLFSASLFLTL